MSAQNVKTDDKNSSGEALYNLLLEVSRAPGSYMVEEYVAEEDVYNRKKMLPDLIYAWTGVLDEDKFGRGQYLSDARKLEALEVIIGRDFTSAYGANPAEGAQVKNTMQCNISN